MVLTFSTTMHILHLPFSFPSFQFLSLSLKHPLILPVMEAILASISDMSALILLASPETRDDCGRARTSDKLSTLLPRDGGKLKRPASPCFKSYIFKNKKSPKPAEAPP